MSSQHSYSASLNQRIETSLRQIKKIRQSDIFGLRQILRNIIISQEFDNWIVLRQILENKELKTIPYLYESVIKAFDGVALLRQQTYVMLVFIYGWVKSNKQRISLYTMYRLIKDFTLEGKILILTSWLSEANIQSPEVSETIQMMSRYYPSLIQQENIKIDRGELQLIIQLVCRADLKSTKQFEQFDKLCQTVKLFRLEIQNYRNENRGYNDEKEGHVIIKTAIDVLANTKNCTGSVSWIFVPPSLVKTDIRHFNSSFSQQILLYTENQLVNIFSKLFQSSFEENCLVLFFGFSKIFQEAQKFYEMKILYQKIVLPIIVRRGKAKLNLTEDVLEIGTYYVIGFYEHCDIGQNGMLCLLSNVEKIEKKNVKLRWIELAFLVAHKNKKFYDPIIFENLFKQCFSKQQLTSINNQKSFSHFSDTTVWQITKRNSQKLKVYAKNISKTFKGIQNHGLQCYIISVMQALFTTKELVRILKDFRGAQRSTLSSHISELFDRLVDKYSVNISVDAVKREGPEFFALSEGQEDAQQYLLKVFEMIQEELGKQKQYVLLNAFNKAFKSKISRKLQCQNCQLIINIEEEEFIHTISNRISLREKQVEQISDYTCDKCKSKNFLNKMQLHPSSTIFIVHFNRFSFKNEKGQKELATQNILRDFMGYRLKGIVFHIGKKIEFGHYVYYFCCGGKKWIEMNDYNVTEFELDHEDEEFERQMKSEKTPYLLFYAKK